MMRRALIHVLLLSLVCACGRSGMRRDQKNYDVVQEGVANGVTSTIQGPGESMPPVTGTNADTTTAFTIDPTTAAGQPAQGTIAGTLPSAEPPRQVPVPMTAAAPVAAPAMAPTQRRQTPAVRQATPAPPTETAPLQPTPSEPATETAEPAPEVEPEPAENAPTETAPPTSTDTVAAPAEKPPAEPDEPPPPPPPPPSSQRSN